MSDTRLSRAEQIFVEACELAGPEQAAYVERACRGDEALCREVERMLEADRASAAYFESLPGRLGIDSLRDGRPTHEYRAEVGQQFGQYRLTEPLGSGGMGTVWRAERADGRFEGEVAVKLLSRARTTAAIARFNREAHYLAKLTHPNIAHLIDAGIDTDEVQYLILEYVEGTPIDRFCDDHEMSIDERLALFIGVIDAVSHAHSRLIVHNDIKPSNVLVTADRTVKLLDFGIATLLSDDDARDTGVALTPEFASPEQLTGQSVTTATDVYSLGLLLYQLLTGKSARQLSAATSLDELRKEATRDPPTLISTLDDSLSVPAEVSARLARRRRVTPGRLRRVFRGELDNIVRKALAVDPRQRYANGAEFAQDLRRYLRNEPVSALPDTFNYRTRKFVARHRGGVLTASLTVLALIAATVITTWQSIEAKRQRDLAIRQQERVLATNDFLNMLLGELGPRGEMPSLQDLIDRGVAIIETQYGDSERSAAMTLYELSVLYGRIGALEKQISALDRSEAIARNADDDGLLATALCAKARLKIEHEPQAAAADLAAGNEASARLPRSQRFTIPECYRAEALTHSIRGDHDAAIAVYQTALDVLEEAPVSSPGLRLQFLSDLGEQYYLTGRAGKALEILERIVRYHEEIGRGNTVTHVIYLANRAAVLSRLGEVASAAGQQRDILNRLEAMENAPIGIASHYAANLARLGRYEEAIEFVETDYEAADAAGNQRRAGEAAMQLGAVLVRLGRADEAALYLDTASSIFDASPGAYERQIVTLALSRSELELHRGDRAAARQRIETILTELGYPEDLSAIGLSSALWHAANLALIEENAPDAFTYANDNLGIVTRAARDPDLSADVGQALLQRARAQLALGDRDAAISDLRRAVVSLTNGFGDGHWETAEARRLLDQLAD